MSNKTEFLGAEELKSVTAEDFWIPGKPYLIVQGFGWGVVGFFVKQLNPALAVFAHLNHFRNAGKDYGKLATEGAGDNCEWRYEGTALVNVISGTLRVVPYCGKVPRQ